MLNPEVEQKYTCIRICAKACNTVCSTIAVIVVPLLIMLFVVTFALKSVDKIQIVYIDRWKLATHRTSAKFLSIGLDSSVIADGFHNFNMTDIKLIKMIRYLYPAYLRVGGNLADRLYFSPDLIEPDKEVTKFYKDLPYKKDFNLESAPNYTMTGIQWLKLMKLVDETGLRIIFDLNSLIRFPNGSWDYRNAESLIHFSNDHKLNLNWELGNEPNSFKHKFNEAINATQMAADFSTLRGILKKYPRYSKSLLVGPDTTRPLEKHKESEFYLRQFSRNAMDVIDALTWHQYYINGRTATSEDFLNPEVFDLLGTQIQTVQNITKSLPGWNKPVWLGETSSAYGGGAPGLSDTFIGSFMWVDKLGLAAKLGIGVVIRQSIFKGYYALLDDNYDPNPDWWISVLYKKLVGSRVVPCHTVSSPNVRLYCHCLKEKLFATSTPAVVVFGMNMDKSAAHVRIEGLFPYEYEREVYEHTPLTTVYAFEFMAKSLYSKSVYLNDKPLKMSADNSLPKFQAKTVTFRPFVTMPPFSVVFWVIPTPYVRACVF